MPAATLQPIRLHLWQAAQQGQSPLAIARDLDLPVRTVRPLLQPFRPAGQACPPRFDHRLFERSMSAKRISDSVNDQ